jgi:DNA-binding NtrC family response regulator
VQKDLIRILIVDDEVNQRTALAGVVRRWGYQVETAENGSDALAKLGEFPADVVITDLNMPVMDGRGLLEELRKLPAPPQSIVLTAFGSLETELETVHRLGAFWNLEKPVQATALQLILARAVEKHRLAGHAISLERELASHGRLGELSGNSPAMREVFSLLQQVAPTKATVLITGESGTGKELTARTIHQLSASRGGPFFAINCAAMPETLIESELFGHEKGAFTGAVERRAGCFELARGGTLLLDEIGDMPIATQAKLLRVLEERKVRRLGSPRETDVDVRVIASTNKDLRESIAKGAFREDLFFRLNVFEVRLPALRERMEDLPMLTAGLLVDLNAKHGCRVTEISPEVSGLLESYSWPGNVRELRNVIERSVILAGSGVITPAHLPHVFLKHGEHAAAASAGVAASGSASASDPSGVSLAAGMTVEDAERALIELTLRHTGGNRTRAAEILDISPKTLLNKLKAYSGA